eukprot:TRINITY_DN4353_c0_g1_i1.p1 TRINITY_DN4353_c0_g1~~TRINITY_DN4353_c0_g1_i1.p1  ORF type:complete len:202 (-),score=43.05 TRINITY_DN4353_c0_g1_i1:199-804(-)
MMEGGASPDKKPQARSKSGTVKGKGGKNVIEEVEAIQPRSREKLGDMDISNVETPKMISLFPRNVEAGVRMEKTHEAQGGQRPQLTISPTQVISPTSGDFKQLLASPTYSPIKRQTLNSIGFNLYVGKIQDGLASLLTEDFQTVEMPLNFLPPDIRRGNILRFNIEKNTEAEEARRQKVIHIQEEIMASLEKTGAYSPEDQ